MRKNFSVVGVGCSAGGVEALKSVVGHLSAESVAYVVVQHLSPQHESMMVQILQKLTHFPVKEVKHGMKVEPGVLFITPPGELITLTEEDEFSLKKIDLKEDRTPLHTIDNFFKSMANLFKERAVGVILSGSGSDGMRGCRLIKERGGVVIAENPETAQFSSMPSNVVSSGLADSVASLTNIPEAIKAVTDAIENEDELYPDSDEQAQTLESIIKIISEHSGIDFGQYKRQTLQRRINKRAAVRKIDNLVEYLRLLNKEKDELGTIAREFLIGVTAFFRDKEAYESLEKNVIQNLVKNVGTNGEIRVWVPACSTGEEAYSIAMLLDYHRNQSGKSFDFRIFGSDIDEGAIRVAQNGVYNESILADLPLRFRTKYFKEYGDHQFIVSRAIKDRIVFSRHDIITDPPFGRMDLISFRNCSIYLKKETQYQILTVLEYSLNIGGFLFLGSSESLPQSSSMETVDSPAKIFRKNTMRTVHTHHELLRMQNERLKRRPYSKRRIKRQDEVLLEVSHSIFKDMLPPSVLINKEGELLHIFGEIGNYASLRTGAFDGTFFEFLHKELRSAVNLAVKKLQADIDYNDSFVHRVRKAGPEKSDVLIEVRRFFSDSYDQVFLVSFRDVRLPDESELGSAKVIDQDEVVRLRDELAQSQRDLEFTIENLETTNEELQSTNEELVTSNEELQSTNEELQSVNEELHTMNSEFQDKIEELSQSNRDMDMLLNVSKVGTLFLDHELKIRKISKQAMAVLDLREGDIGRSITYFSEPLYSHFVEDCYNVLKNEKPLEQQVQIPHQGWCLVKIHPHHDYNENISGLVVFMINISELKAIRESRDWLFRFLLSENEISFGVDEDGVIDLWTKSAEEFFGYSESEVLGKNENILLPLESYADIEVIHSNVTNGQPVYLNKTYRLSKDDVKIDVTLVASGRYSESGSLQGIQYTLFPAVDSHEAEESRLYQELSFLRNLLEALPYGVMIVNIDGTYRYVNQACCDIFELTADEIYRRKVQTKEWDVRDLDGKALPVEDFTYSKVMSERQPVLGTQLSLPKGKNGDRVNVLIDGVPYVESGELIGGLFTIRKMNT